MNSGNRRYLRRTSLLVQDYVTGFVVVAGIYVAFRVYNRKVNPPEPAVDDEGDTSIPLIIREVSRYLGGEIDPLQYLRSYFQKQFRVMARATVL
jgi:hypothetical protein